MIVDYHVHLRGCANGDREGPVEHTLAAVERFVETAAARQVDEIGFTEHMYYFREFEPLIKHPYQRGKIGHDLDAYVGTVVEAKRSLPVKLGLEVEWFPGREAELAERLAPYPWDYLLGSVHLLDGEEVDRESGVWSELSVEDVWRRYFASLRALAESGLVDVLAHPDLVKIFGRRPSAAVVQACHEEAAEAAAASGVAVEVSTAGLRKPVGELYPDRSLLAACGRRGVGATTASDAHRAEDVGRDFDRALALLGEEGYETVTVFEGRGGRQARLE